MKLEHKNTKSAGKSSFRLMAFVSLRSLICAFCFVFLPLRLMASLETVASANSVTAAVTQSNPDSSADPNNPTLARQLRLTEISASRASKDNESKRRLREIIERIRAVEFASQTQTPEPPAVPRQTPVIEPNKADSEASVQKEKAETVNKPELPYEPVAEQTLEMLRNLSQKPEQLENPLELAEILFLSGNLKEAALLYQEALKRQDANDKSASKDRAWIIFQTANCLRNSDMPAAAKMYGRLLTEYPNSTWADLASARAKLIDWYLKDDPEKLVVEARHAESNPE